MKKILLFQLRKKKHREIIEHNKYTNWIVQSQEIIGEIDLDD